MSAPQPLTGTGGQAAPGPMWTVGAVAARLGVAASTLRSWSLRYGIGPVGHRAGQHRRYAASDIAELDTLSRLVEQGMALPAAVAVVRGRRPGRGVDSDGGDSGAVDSGRAVRVLVTAARDLDPVAAAGIVSAGFARHGVVATWEQLCRPALAALDNPVLGRLPSEGGSTGRDSCIGPELTLSWAVAASLHRLPTPSVRPDAPRVALACAEGEQHTLGLEALFAGLVEQGIDARLLGTSVNGQVLCEAVANLHPAVVVVWAQVQATAAPVPVSTLASGTAVLVAAGPGWAQIGLEPHVVRVDSLRGALAAVAATR